MTAHADEAMRLNVMLRAREPQANRKLREVTEQFQAVYDQGLFAARLRLKRALRVRHRGPFHRQGKSLECSRRGEGQSFAKSVAEDGTFRTWPVWQTMSTFGCIAEVAFQGREVRV